MNLSEFQRSEKADDDHLLLFGNPVSYSLSPIMHNKATELLGMDVRYYAIALRADELDLAASYINKESFKGGNVTIPYKHMFLEYMDELSLAAKSVGAVNTIVKNNNRIEGDNTDIYGFSVPLKPYAGELNNARAVIFGTGGATKAIVHALNDFGIEEMILISRNPESVSYFDKDENVRVESYQAWASFAEEAALIVNATPLGMEPDEDTAPVRESEKELLESKICYDIIYNPLKTKFLTMAEEAGARTIGGLQMLVEQGNKSFERWTGRTFPVEKIMNTLHEELQAGT